LQYIHALYAYWLGEYFSRSCLFSFHVGHLQPHTRQRRQRSSILLFQSKEPLHALRVHRISRKALIHGLALLNRREAFVEDGVKTSEPHFTRDRDRGGGAASRARGVVATSRRPRCGP